MSLQIPFWEVLLSCNEAKREDKDGVSLFTFPGSTSLNL